MEAAARRTAIPIPLVAFAITAIGFAITAVEPRFPKAWMLEHVPTVLLVPFAVKLYRRRALSDRAWMQLAAFALLHFYGAHYTYANAPLGFWLRDVFSLSRNHYDRIVHFASGALLLGPVRELAFPPEHRSTVGRELFVSFALIGAIALAYEQLEWITASVVAPEAGIAFLGTQGDVWDAQKDATAATIGAALALIPEFMRAPRSSALGDQSRNQSRKG